MTAAVLLGYLRTLGAAQVEQILAHDHVVRRAQQYHEDGRVAQVWVDGAAVRAHVSGSSATSYHCVLRLRDGALESECSCPYRRGLCWHTGAVLFSIVADSGLTAQLERQARGQAGELTERAADGDPPAREGERGASRAAAEPGPSPGQSEALRDRLLALPKDRLAAVLAELAVADPLLETRLIEMGQERDTIDVRLFRQAARAALRPGQHLGRFDVPRVAADLQEIAASILRLTQGGNPERALDLLLEVAWLAWQRRDDADDRDGALIAVVRQLLGEWIRGWSQLAARDRQKLARELFGWMMEDGGSVTGGLILEGKSALGPIGLDTLGALLRPLVQRRIDGRPAFALADEGDFDPLLERLHAALRETAEARGQLDEFIATCDAEGMHGGEIVAATQRLAAAGQLNEALRWSERGRRRARGSARHELDDLRIALLTRLDRRREANEAAWEMFVAEPGAAALRRLVATAGDGERHDWRRRALDHVESTADASAVLDVCLEADDLERLAHRLDSAPNFVLSADASLLERFAARADGRIPWAAARVALHLSSRLLAAGDAKHYGKARQLLAQAKRSFLADGNQVGWDEASRRLLEAHAVVRIWLDAL